MHTLRVDDTELKDIKSALNMVANYYAAAQNEEGIPDKTAAKRRRLYKRYYKLSTDIKG